MRKTFFCLLLMAASACGVGTASSKGGTGSGPGNKFHTDAANVPESWVWVYGDWSASLDSIVANANAFTHVSPTFYSLNNDYTAGLPAYATCSTQGSNYICTDAGTNTFGSLTTTQFTQRLAAAGLATVPAIYAGSANGGSDQGVQNILNDPNGAGARFIASMLAEALSNGYAGYNLDWEMGNAVGSAYADKFVRFVDAFKAALAPHGLSLSADAIVNNINGTFCSGSDGYLDFAKLSASQLDRLIIEAYTPLLGSASTSCRSVPLSTARPAACPVNSSGTHLTATGLLDYMCSNLPASMVVIGLESYSAGTNPIAGEVVSTLKAYGLNKIAVWPESESGYPFLSTKDLSAPEDNWYDLLRGFLRDSL